MLDAMDWASVKCELATDSGGSFAGGEASTTRPSRSVSTVIIDVSPDVFGVMPDFGDMPTGKRGMAPVVYRPTAREAIRLITCVLDSQVVQAV